MGSDYTVEKIVLFDGVCNLCSASVQFILRHNSKNNLRFASLQSEFGRTQLQKIDDTSEVKTMVYIDRGKIFLRSDAILETCRELNGIFPLLRFFKIIPRPIRDSAYNFIAKYRYRWFGKKDQCWIPSREISHRFIS
jgi:predicted DCC family thiol-disulfide oxidoreductase YuxK